MAYSAYNKLMIYIFLIFPKKIGFDISQRDKLHEMSKKNKKQTNKKKPLFSGKKYLKMSPVKIFTQHAKC